MSLRTCTLVREHRLFGIGDGDGFAALDHPTR
jgi:hypothetical protein